MNNNENKTFGLSDGYDASGPKSFEDYMNDVEEYRRKKNEEEQFNCLCSIPLTPVEKKHIAKTERDRKIKKGLAIAGLTLVGGLAFIAYIDFAANPEIYYTTFGGKADGAITISDLIERFSDNMTKVFGGVK